MSTAVGKMDTTARSAYLSTGGAPRAWTVASAITASTPHHFVETAEARSTFLI